VVRILDRTVHTIDLKDLGFEPRMLTACKTILDRHQGIFLVTGPTGSGKTTTLYAALSYLHSPEKNIVTLEDPVEYDIEGITQGQINPEIGFTFEVGIRALLRQDPDILMIGEIRDKQTAHVAIEASLTGHLIMSTLHTNDSVGALVRLVDMGIDPYLINASLVGVLAQRLVRKLCSDCKTEDSATADERSLFGIEKVFRPAGCSHCAQRGYWGRVGIFELLIISPEIRALMSAHPNKDEITTLALAQGMQTLCMDGITKIKEGFVSPAELMRVLF
jgi:type II secretory ATPase GspE/PulE/Tfp pilus assembly ATPase PilB-like protein